MKRTLTLLAVTMITVNSVGCCCCSGLRNWGLPAACYGPTAAVAPTPLYAAAPAPTYSPLAGYAAAPSVPVFQHCAPQSPCAPQMPQYSQAAPAQMAYADPNCGCGTPYMTEMGCGTPYMTEMGCGYNEGMYSDGMIMSSPEMYPGPGPE